MEMNQGNVAVANESIARFLSVLAKLHTLEIADNHDLGNRLLPFA